MLNDVLKQETIIIIRPDQERTEKLDSQPTGFMKIMNWFLVFLGIDLSE